MVFYLYWKLVKRNLEIYEKSSRNFSVRQFLNVFFLELIAILETVSLSDSNIANLKNRWTISKNTLLRFTRPKNECLGVSKRNSSARSMCFYKVFALLRSRCNWTNCPAARVDLYTFLPSWILEFWHQICNQRTQKPPYTNFIAIAKNCEFALI